MWELGGLVRFPVKTPIGRMKIIGGEGDDSLEGGKDRRDSSEGDESSTGGDGGMDALAGALGDRKSVSRPD